MIKKTNKLFILALSAYCLFGGINSNAQVINTVAGNGTQGFSGDNGPATIAQINSATGVAFDGAGNMYIADRGNYRVRKVTPSGIITTIAGNGTNGFSGDTGPATSAQLYTPYGVAADAAGNVYIADAFNNRIRKVSTTGIITTFAGGGSSITDGVAATAAYINCPIDVTLDLQGNLYISEYSGNKVRKVSPSGIITTVAGNGTAGYSGDGGLATNAQLRGPCSVTFDAASNVYIADGKNHVIRKVTPGGYISTYAGNGVNAGAIYGTFSGDNGPATAAGLSQPWGVAMDGMNNLYIGDQLNHRIRMVNSAGIITTVVGNGIQGSTGDGGPPSAAEINYPAVVTFDPSGNFYIAENVGQRIRQISGTMTLTVNSATICAGSTTTLTANGAGTYTWSPSTGLNTTTGYSVVANPSVTTVYTVTGTQAFGTQTATATSTVVVNPTPTITVNSPNLCAGSSATLTASGASTYSWSTGATSPSIIVSPGTTTSYTVTGTSTQGCTGSATALVTVFAIPNVTVNSATVCAGATATLTANGAVVYSWNTGATTNTISAAPATTTTYTVSGSNLSHCTGTATATITVLPLPSVTVNSPSICVGATATLTASGASTYSWNTSATTASISVAPTTTTNYTVTGTSSQGCKKTVTSTVTVNPLPSVTVNSPTVCVGSSVTLTASGANTYSWNTGATTPSITVAPSSNTSYTVIGTSAQGCKRTVTTTVSVPGTNIPMFNLSDNTNLSSYATISAIASNSTTTGSAGYGYVYILEELTSGGAQTWIENSNPCYWWQFPSATTFKGIDNSSVDYPAGTVAYNSSTSANMPNPTTPCQNPADGKFAYAKTYRITLGSWTSVCPWTQSSQTITLPSFFARESAQSVIVNSDAPDFSYLQYKALNISGSEEVTNDKMTIYPNPNNGSFTIETFKTTPHLIEIFDLNGQMVMSQAIIGKTTITASDLTEGVYNVRISGTDTVANKKIIVLK